MNFPPPTQKQARIIWFAVTAMAVAGCVSLLASLLWGVGKVLNLLSPVLWPLAVAAVLACVLDPLVNAMERRGIRRIYAILLTFLAGLAVVGAFLGAIIPRLVDEAGLLVARVPSYSQQMQQRVVQWVAEPPKELRWIFRKDAGARTAETNAVATAAQNPSPDNRATHEPKAAPAESPEAAQKRIIQALTGWATDILPKITGWILDRLVQVTSLFGVLVGLGLIPVYAFYFLREKRGIQSKWTDYLPVQDSSFKDELVFVLKAIQEYLVAFFRGQVLVATCDAALYTIGFLAMGLNYAFLLGAMAQVLVLIPFIGAIIICGTAVVLAAVQFQDLLHPLLALGVFGVVQTVEGLFISPRIMGSRVGLHPLTILIAVMVGTTLLGGVLGGILAIPLTAALRVLMFRYVWKKRAVS